MARCDGAVAFDDMQHSPTATRRSRTLALAGLIALSTSCSAVGGGDDRTLDCVSLAPAEVVAWVIADACRDHHPGIDPWPGTDSSPVPIVRETNGAWIVAIGGRETLRTACNGRLAAPRLQMDGRLGAILSPGSWTDLDRATVHGGSRIVEVRVESRPGATGVSVHLGGGADHGPLFRRIVEAIALLDTIESVAERLERDDLATAERLAARALEDVRRRGVTGLAAIEACLYLQRGLIAERRGEVLTARSFLCSAMSLTPDETAILAKRAELDARIARAADATRSQQLLAAGVGDPAEIRTAVDELDAAARAARWSAPAELAAATAVRLLAAGDTLGGLSWARSARALGGDATRVARLDAHARARGDHHSAFVVGLARLQRRGFDADLVAALCADALAAGDAPSALRVLAAHWEELAGVDADLAEALLDRAARVAGPALAARVVSSYGNEMLAERTLDAWRSATGDRLAGHVLLERVPHLRALHPLVSGALPARDAWDLAPGVAPLR